MEKNLLNLLNPCNYIQVSNINYNVKVRSNLFLCRCILSISPNGWLIRPLVPIKKTNTTMR